MSNEYLILLLFLLGGGGLYVFIQEQSRNSLLQDLMRELGVLKDQYQSLKIRVDDTIYKMNTAVTDLTRRTSINDSKLKTIQEKLQSAAGSPVKMFELESDDSLEKRLERIEEILHKPADAGDSLSAQESPTNGSHAELKLEEAGKPGEPPVTPPSPLVQGMEGVRAVVLKGVQAIVASAPASVEDYLQSLKSLLREQELDGLLDDKLRGAFIKVWTESAKNSPGKMPLSVGDTSTMLAHALQQFLQPIQMSEEHSSEKTQQLQVMLFIGARGCGRSTAAAGCAHLFLQEGRKVLVADCVPAASAASEPLSLWAKRLNIPAVTIYPGAKPHSVAYKAIHRAQDERMDVLIVDSPAALDAKGRIDNAVIQVARMILRERPHPPHDTVLVLDATGGEQALEQAQVLHKEGGFSGLCITKMDKIIQGGRVFTFAHKLAIPVWYLNLGANGKAFSRFSGEEYAQAMFGIEKPKPKPAVAAENAPVPV